MGLKSCGRVSKSCLFQKLFTFPLDSKLLYGQIVQWFEQKQRKPGYWSKLKQWLMVNVCNR